MTAFVQADIPIPARAYATSGARKSDIRQKLEGLFINQCLTIPADNKDAQRRLAKKLNATVNTCKKNTGYQYVLRSMLGEMDNDLIHVVRIWRTA